MNKAEKGELLPFPSWPCSRQPPAQLAASLWKTRRNARVAISEYAASTIAAASWSLARLTTGDPAYKRNADVSAPITGYASQSAGST